MFGNIFHKDSVNIISFQSRTQIRRLLLTKKQTNIYKVSIYPQYKVLPSLPVASDLNAERKIRRQSNDKH